MAHEQATVMLILFTNFASAVEQIDPFFVVRCAHCQNLMKLINHDVLTFTESGDICMR